MQTQQTQRVVMGIVIGIMLVWLSVLPVGASHDEQLLQEYREGTDPSLEAWTFAQGAQLDHGPTVSRVEALLSEYRHATDPSLEAWSTGVGAELSTVLIVGDTEALLREFYEATDPSLEAWAVGVRSATVR
ncbi:MAG: hypothetical protein JXA74_03170 [Anaerolineae bacterium]|nr:hypothetical protein [Anaerolineae bacterium]